MDEPKGLDRMLGASLLAHFALIAAVVFAPGGWLDSRKEPPKTVMTISLSGGNDGPTNSGMTAMGGRAVQELKPPDEPKRPEAVRPPAAVVPDMTVPVPSKAPTKAPPPPK